MPTLDAASRSEPRGWDVHLRGHVFLFGKRPASAIEGTAGTRLLLVAIVLEAGRLIALNRLYPRAPLAILLPLLLVVALSSVRFVAGLDLSQIGLYPWRAWNAIEKSYFIQLLVIANVVFPAVFAARLGRVLAQPSPLRTVGSVFVPYLFFGFYQEVVYRGMLQTELVRRWGAFAGILAANLLYTFGPLHAYYLATRASLAVPMFAAVFAIGLFFGTLFWRSGNLWIVAVMHGVGNAYIVGSLASPAISGEGQLASLDPAAGAAWLVSLGIFAF